MDTLDALILGIVQGLAEYLPISSSGHLAIFREFLGIDLDGAQSLQFDITLHVATVLSTIVILWREFWPLCKSFFTFKRDSNFQYVCKILLSCIPIGIVGVCFKDTIEGIFGKGIDIVGFCLLATAVLLTFSYITGKRSAENGGRALFGGTTRDITYLDAFIIGCSQAIAVLPGLSRSGTTIATGIIIGDKREQIAQFSFFMVIIPILGEALLDCRKLFAPEVIDAAAGVPEMSLQAILVGFVASFVVGCLACKWMLEIVKKGKLIWFAVYCAIVGAICVAKSQGLF